MKIRDQHGRIGEVTEVREHGLFVKPEHTSYIIDDTERRTGVDNARIITAAWWQRQPDGSYQGSWYDSPLHTRLTAQMI